MTIGEQTQLSVDCPDVRRTATKRFQSALKSLLFAWGCATILALLTLSEGCATLKVPIVRKRFEDKYRQIVAIEDAFNPPTGQPADVEPVVMAKYRELDAPRGELGDLCNDFDSVTHATAHEDLLLQCFRRYGVADASCEIGPFGLSTLQGFIKELHLRTTVFYRYLHDNEQRGPN
jgi:hypothetical protein